MLLLFCLYSTDAESEALLHKLHSQYVREAFEPRTCGARPICCPFYALRTCIHKAPATQAKGLHGPQLPLQSSSSRVVMSILADLLGHALLVPPLAPSLARDVLRALGSLSKRRKVPVSSAIM